MIGDELCDCESGFRRHLSVEKNRSLYIRLFPEPSRVSKEQPPIARFVLRVTTSGSNRRPYISPSTYLFFFFATQFLTFPFDYYCASLFLID